jgi:hypothetical protein
MITYIAAKLRENMRHNVESLNPRLEFSAMSVDASCLSGALPMFA